jgi:hypothetical protein
MRKPGHREGVRRYQRYGQLTLAVGKTLKPAGPRCAVCRDRSCEFCPKVRP